jgi:hypothetical protein
MAVQAAKRKQGRFRRSTKDVPVALETGGVPMLARNFLS